MPDPALSSTLLAFAEAGRRTWPSFRIDAREFTAHVAQLEGPTLERAPDLYLAFACSTGLKEAIRAFDPVLRGAVAATAARFDPSRDFAAEVTQILREKLLVDRPPKIASYGGRAALPTWLGVTARRQAQKMRRRKADDPTARAAFPAAMEAPAEGAEGAFLRARYRPLFAEALRSALASLSARERALLRSNVVNRVGAERLGEEYGVGKSTAARWLVAVRERLVAETRANVQARMRLTQSEYESIAGLLRSDIDLSVARLLGTQGAPHPVSARE
jgi:RNA polymerase sigma-70 factor, ECF subfamily